MKCFLNSFGVSLEQRNRFEILINLFFKSVAGTVMIRMELNNQRCILTCNRAFIYNFFEFLIIFEHLKYKSHKKRSLFTSECMTVFHCSRTRSSAGEFPRNWLNFLSRSQRESLRISENFDLFFFSSQILERSKISKNKNFYLKLYFLNEKKKFCPEISVSFRPKCHQL